MSLQEGQVRSQLNLCGICGGQSGIGTVFASSTSVATVTVIPPMYRIHISFSNSRRRMMLLIYSVIYERRTESHE